MMKDFIRALLVSQKAQWVEEALYQMSNEKNGGE
jgi:hypothetical protein